MDIIFTDLMGVPEKYAPTPAFENIPEWYKKLESYMSGNKFPVGDTQTSATIKKCMPVFDAITCGYILYTYTDVWVVRKPNQNGDIAPHFETRAFKPIDFHIIEQAPNHPNRTDEPYLKWVNAWGIKTPKGYSSLFLQPVHRESPFTILPGVVDTDEYSSPVHFPFTFNTNDFTGLIPAGTPIAQVIPFKREKWNMKFGGEKEHKENNKTSLILNTKFFDSYKTQFRQNKHYK